jgi:hypothetical protein
MAASTLTTLPVYNGGFNKTWQYTGHTITLPRLIIQKRRVPTGSQTVSENSITILRGGLDAAGNVLPSKGSFQFIAKEPIGYLAADRDALIADFRNFVNGDEFALMLPGCSYWR